MHRIWNEIRSLEKRAREGWASCLGQMVRAHVFLGQVRAPPQARSESYIGSSQRRVEEVSRSWRKRTRRWGTLDSN